MATFTLSRFSTPERLKSIREDHLLALLGRHGDYFKQRGVELATFNGSGIDYDGIVKVLMSPDTSTPKPLSDDLYFVHEMATPSYMDELLEELRGLPQDERAVFTLGSDVTPADVAVQVRLLAPDLIERKHAEHFLTSKRSFEYFQSKKDLQRKFKAPSAAKLSALDGALADRFEEMKRGRSAKVFIFHRDDGIWFLVRHGDTYKREGAIEAGTSSSVYYRPEIYDVIKYDEGLGDLCVNANGNKKICALYREKLGLHFFGDAQRFAERAKYTLEPLREDGEDALVCSDIDGIDAIRLKEIQFFWGGSENEVEIRKASDIFAVLKRKQRGLPAKVALSSAKFDVKFTDSKTPRTVAIRPSNVASYTRDADAGAVEQWLQRRGFARQVAEGSHARADAPVARP